MQTQKSATAFTVELLLLIGLLILGWWYATTQLHLELLPQSTTEQTGSVIVSNGYHDVRGLPSLTGDQINSILCKAESPACGTGNDLYQLGVQYGINSAYALAFFWHESNYGLKGRAVVNHSLGNIRCTAGYRCNGGYRFYPSWQAG